MRTIMSIATIAIIATAAASHDISQPQVRPTTSTANSKAVDMGSISKELGNEAIRLREQTASSLKRLDELESILATGQQNSERATAMVAELLSLLREAAARLAPNGKYVKTLDAEIATVNGIADRARAHTDTEIRRTADWYAAKSDEISDIRRKAEELRTTLIAQIDRLEQEEERLAFAVAATHIDAFIRNAREYLNVVTGIAGGAKGLADSIGNAFGTNLPTQ
jgi:hypothetical protein